MNAADSQRVMEAARNVVAASEAYNDARERAEEAWSDAQELQREAYKRLSDLQQAHREMAVVLAEIAANGKETDNA